MTDAIDIDLEAWDRFSDAGSLASSGASSSMGRSETPSVAESVVSLETIRAKVDEIQKTSKLGPSSGEAWSPIPSRECRV